MEPYDAALLTLLALLSPASATCRGPVDLGVGGAKKATAACLL